jgi:hypothetical protein
MKPGPSLFIAALLWLFFAAAAYFYPFLLIFWIYTGLALVPIVGADFLYLLLLCDRLKIKRKITATLAQGRQTRVKLVINRESAFRKPHRISTKGTIKIN